MTKTAISTEGWYGNASVENITIPANLSFNNLGFSMGSYIGANSMTFQGNATFANGNQATSINGQNGFGFSSGGSTITINQRSGGINAFAAVTAYNYTNGTTNGTITHLAGFHVLAPYQTSSALLAVTNYYGLLINASDERTAFTITNRFGIYQEGVNDKNYFASKILIGSTTDNGYLLQCYGNAYFRPSAGINALFQTSGSAFRINYLNDASSANISASYRAIDFAWQKGDGTQIAKFDSDGKFILGGNTGLSIFNLEETNIPRIQLLKTGIITWFIGNTNLSTSNYFSIGTDSGGNLNILNLSNFGNCMIGSTTDTGNKLYLNGSLRIDGQSSGTSGGNSGQHLIINLDGTTYKIKLENP